MTNYRMLFKVTLVNGDTYELKYPVDEFEYRDELVREVISRILNREFIFTAADFVIVPRFIVDVYYMGKVM